MWNSFLFASLRFPPVLPPSFWRWRCCFLSFYVSLRAPQPFWELPTPVLIMTPCLHANFLLVSGRDLRPVNFVSIYMYIQLSYWLFPLYNYNLTKDQIWHWSLWPKIFKAMRWIVCTSRFSSKSKWVVTFINISWTLIKVMNLNFYLCGEYRSISSHCV